MVLEVAGEALMSDFSPNSKIAHALVRNSYVWRVCCIWRIVYTGNYGTDRGRVREIAATIETHIREARLAGATPFVIAARVASGGVAAKGRGSCAHQSQCAWTCCLAKSSLPLSQQVNKHPKLKVQTWKPADLPEEQMQGFPVANNEIITSGKGLLLNYDRCWEERYS